MDGLDLLGAEVKKEAPYIGLGVGALIGGLVSAFVGKHTGGVLGRASLFGWRVPYLAKIAAGVAGGAAAGGGIGYGVRRALESGGPGSKKKGK